jgi:hypothetical protein
VHELLSYFLDFSSVSTFGMLHHLSQAVAQFISTKCILYSTHKVHLKALRQYNALPCTSRTTTSGLFLPAMRPNSVRCLVNRKSHISQDSIVFSVMNKRKAIQILQSCFIMHFVMLALHLYRVVRKGIIDGQKGNITRK